MESSSVENKSIGIVGMGLMGRGIAQVAATAGLRTILCKHMPGELGEGRRAIESSLERAVANGRMTAEARDATLGRLTYTSQLSALRGVDLVVESIVEDLAAKQRLFAALETQVGSETVLATNTSSLPIARIATALSAPERFLGMHFFSPVPAMKLVEVSGHRATTPAALARAEAFVGTLGKTPILVRDSAGLIVNRLLVPYLLDAIRSLEAGLAPAASIDLAMRLGCGHPMGPLELADAIGLDVVLAMARSLRHALDDSRYDAPRMLERLVSVGRLGKKTGAGFYDYDAARPSASPG